MILLDTDHISILQRVRVATTDLKIASIAFAADYLLLTANSRDFGAIPGLRFENWL